MSLENVMPEHPPVLWLRHTLLNDPADPCVVMLREDAEDLLATLDAAKARIKTASSNRSYEVLDDYPKDHPGGSSEVTA